LPHSWWIALGSTMVGELLCFMFSIIFVLISITCYFILIK
jgi:hypothetical protein